MLSSPACVRVLVESRLLNNRLLLQFVRRHSPPVARLCPPPRPHPQLSWFRLWSHSRTDTSINNNNAVCHTRTHPGLITEHDDNTMQYRASAPHPKNPPNHEALSPAKSAPDITTHSVICVTQIKSLLVHRRAHSRCVRCDGSNLFGGSTDALQDPCCIAQIEGPPVNMQVAGPKQSARLEPSGHRKSKETMAAGNASHLHYHSKLTHAGCPSVPIENKRGDGQETGRPLKGLAGS